MRKHKRFLSLALASSMILSQFAMTTSAIEEETTHYSSSPTSSEEAEKVAENEISPPPPDNDDEIIENTLEEEYSPTSASQTVEATPEEWLDVGWAEGGKIKFDSDTGTITDAENSVHTVSVPSTINGVAVTTIGQGAFYYNPNFSGGNMRYVSLAEGITRIESQAFHSNSDIIELYLPKSLEYVGQLAFQPKSVFGTGVAAIYYAGSEEEWGNIQIDSSSYLTSNLQTPIVFDYGAAIYDITFELDGGRIIDGTDYALSAKEVTNRQGTLDSLPETPVKGGYEFSHWVTSGGATVDLTTVFEDETTVTAVWTACAESHEITFDSGEGSSVSNMETSKEGKLYWLPEEPTRSGYAFDGWYLEDTYENIVTTSTQFTKNTTVYAKWAMTYTISFENYGTNPLPSVQTDKNGYLTSIPVPSPLVLPDEGTMFEGWYTVADHGTGENKITTKTKFTEDTEVHGYWIDIKEYTITFDTNTYGEVRVNPMYVIAGNSIDNLPTPLHPKYPEYTFGGWYLENGEEVTSTYVFTKDVTLYAKWDISYINNSGFNTNSDRLGFYNEFSHLAVLQDDEWVYDVSSEIKDDLQDLYRANSSITANDYHTVFDIQGKYHQNITGPLGNGIKAGGLCYGMAMAETVVQAEIASASVKDIQSTASRMGQVSEPVDNDEVMTAILYYYLLQYTYELSALNSNILAANKVVTRAQVNAWVDAVKTEPDPLVFCYATSGDSHGLHGVVVYKYALGTHKFIGTDEEVEAHILYKCDPNIKGESEIYFSTSGEVLAETQHNTTGSTQTVKVNAVSTPFAIEDKSGFVMGSTNTTNYASMTTDSPQTISSSSNAYTSLSISSDYDFKVTSNGNSATVEDCVVTGQLELSDPIFYTLDGSIPDYVDYYLSADDDITITFDTQESRSMSVRMSGNTLYFISTDAKAITLTKDGEVKLEDGSGTETSAVSIMLEGDIETPWYGTEISTSNSDLSIQVTGDEVVLDSSELLNGTTINCHEFEADPDKTITLEDTDSTSVTLVPKEDEDNNTKAEILDENNEVVGEVEVVPSNRYDGLDPDPTPDNDPSPDSGKPDSDSDTPDSDSDTPDSDSDTPDSDSDTPDSDSNGNNSGSSSNSSSNSSSSSTYTNTITTSDYGTVSMTPTKAKSGDTVTLEISANDGYEVSEVIVKRTTTGAEIEVTLNDDGTYSFTQPSGTVKIEVVYKEIEEKTTIIDLPMINNMSTSTFADIKSQGQWYYEPVKFVYDRGLMVGTDHNNFSPEIATSRGMIVQILYRLAGSPSVSGSSFSDVSSTDYYSQAVAWASSVGVASGTGDGKFSPNKEMSREELVVMLYAYEKIYGNNDETHDLYLTFSDNDSISTWAEESVAWAVEKGIIFGKDNNNFDPQGSAQRSEVATILMNFVNLYA